MNTNSDNPIFTGKLTARQINIKNKEIKMNSQNKQMEKAKLEDIDVTFEESNKNYQEYGLKQNQ